ncbi:head GIN domain-containing protein [Sphingomonas sp. S2-65]|uniref:head GIN domain-containing protein n=1 Tax=Sphingomonas sp. S2-65 TaxID=2903960 RepID=UPI001F1C478C|nr:head GIN domain-containing protein [Sphingomonas sp. S2-65]UYY57460.1 DUF2807 domain-containing protein [Sphingomonas sp. S2-65]
MRLLLIAAMLPLAACHSNAERKEGHAAQPQGTGGTRSFSVANFDSIDLRGPDDVDVKVGPRFSVTAEGDTAVLDTLDIRVVNGDLRIGREKGSTWFGKDNGAVRIHVVAPRISDTTIAGSGNLSVDRVEGDVDASIAGSGNLVIGAMQATDAELSIAGSGNMKVAGGTQRLVVNIAGSGDVDSTGLTATSGDVSVAGSGSLRGRVKGDVSVSLIGSGDVELTGGARCKTSALGAGEARCS